MSPCLSTLSLFVHHPSSSQPLLLWFISRKENLTWNNLKGESASCVLLTARPDWSLRVACDLTSWNESPPVILDCPAAVCSPLCWEAGGGSDTASAGGKECAWWRSPGGLEKQAEKRRPKWKILCEASSCHVPLSGSVCRTNWFLELLCIVRFGIPTELRCLASLNSVSYNFLSVAFGDTLWGGKHQVGTARKLNPSQRNMSCYIWVHGFWMRERKSEDRKKGRDRDYNFVSTASHQSSRRCLMDGESVLLRPGLPVLSFG